MEKTRCKVHLSQLITNFCANDSCMVQLCATCICEHTQYHHDHLNTKPRYQNIKNTLSLTNERLSQQRQKITQSKNRIKQLMDQVNSKKKEIQTILRASKEDVIKTIEKVFVDMEKQLLLQLEKQKQKTGLHSEEYLEQLYLQINKRSLEIYQKAQQLNSFKYPQMIRKIYTELFQKNKAFLDKIEKQISENQLFKMEVVYQPNALRQICAGVQKIVSTSFSYTSRKVPELSPKKTCPYAKKPCPKQHNSSRSPFHQNINYPISFRNTNPNFMNKTQKSDRSQSPHFAQLGSRTNDNFFMNKFGETSNTPRNSLYF